MDMSLTSVPSDVFGDVCQLLSSDLNLVGCGEELVLPRFFCPSWFIHRAKPEELSALYFSRSLGCAI